MKQTYEHMKSGKQCSHHQAPGHTKSKKQQQETRAPETVNNTWVLTGKRPSSPHPFPSSRLPFPPSSIYPSPPQMPLGSTFPSQIHHQQNGFLWRTIRIRAICPLLSRDMFVHCTRLHSVLITQRRSADSVAWCQGSEDSVASPCGDILLVRPVIGHLSTSDCAHIREALDPCPLTSALVKNKLTIGNGVSF